MLCGHELGDGIVHRVWAEGQRRYWQAPRFVRQRRVVEVSLKAPRLQHTPKDYEGR